MSDNEDPYALSDSDEESLKGPPPKIDIGERTTIDINRIKETLTSDKQEVVKDQAKLEELEELKKIKGEELKKVMESFQEGKICNNSEEETKTVDIEKPTGISKDVLSQFKNKFEHIQETLAANTEEKLKGVEKQLEGLENVGKDLLKGLKENFDGSTKGNATGTEVIKEEIKGKSSNELAKIMGAFANPKIDDEGPKNCAICNKLVYSAEKLLANKNIYHFGCFKCSKCSKKLTPVSFYSHEGNLLCKQHMDFILHPDRAAVLEALDAQEAVETGQGDDDDDEFAISSKPKQLADDVVRAGTNICEELSQIKSLREKKENLQSSIQESEKVDKRTIIEEDIKSGLVKGNVDRFVHTSEEVDSNINKTVVDLDTTQIADIKNRWKTGEVEKEKEIENETKAELEELRKGTSHIKERFCEKTGDEDNEPSVQKSFNIAELDVTNVAAARKSFLEGAAYQSGPIEKTANELSEFEFKKLNSFKERFEKGEDTDNIEKTKVDLDIQLGDIKAAFEKGEDSMTPEERAELKKKEIEAEFLRYKLARKLQAKKAKEEAEQNPQNEESTEKKIEIDTKIAGKAREKFRQIEAENPDQNLPMPGQNLNKTPSKWDKKDTSTAEIVNRSSPQEYNDIDEEEEYDVKNIMNKFKNIGKEENTFKTPKKLEELEGLSIHGKNIRDKFESAPLDNDVSEEKRKALEEEFNRLKEEREKALKQLEEESLSAEQHPSYVKDEINIAAEHAHKMTAKWEKIQQKEAKKAQKGQMSSKTNA
uniref:LIM zinc-binding domain-containing protein n=1 Tax=Parastrongyloides trichosuri TaxID=131310 RepID=A0A0N5A3U0_PARTI